MPNRLPAEGALDIVPKGSLADGTFDVVPKRLPIDGALGVVPKKPPVDGALDVVPKGLLAEGASNVVLLEEPNSKDLNPEEPVVLGDVPVDALLLRSPPR